jgi:hypothetical protein
MRPPWPTLGLLTGVLLLALWSIAPVGDPALPGILAFAVLDGPGELVTESAVRPLCDYISLALRRGVRVHVLDEQRLRERAASFDLLLVPRSLLPALPEHQVLAWARGHGRVGQAPQPVLVRRRAVASDHQLILGDALSWRGDEAMAKLLRERGLEASLSAAAAGHDIYDHSEALAAFAHGAYSAALVRDGDYVRALRDGVLASGSIETELLGPPEHAFALVAGRRLSPRMQREVREAALELDHLRFEDASLRGQLVLASLSRLRIDGFVPVEPFPSLRP